MLKELPASSCLDLLNFYTMHFEKLHFLNICIEVQGPSLEPPCKCYVLGNGAVA